MRLRFKCDDNYGPYGNSELFETPSEPVTAYDLHKAIKFEDIDALNAMLSERWGCSQYCPCNLAFLSFKWRHKSDTPIALLFDPLFSVPIDKLNYSHQPFISRKQWCLTTDTKNQKCQVEAFSLARLFTFCFYPYAYFHGDDNTLVDLLGLVRVNNGTFSSPGKLSVSFFQQCKNWIYRSNGLHPSDGSCE